MPISLFQHKWAGHFFRKLHSGNIQHFIADNLSCVVWCFLMLVDPYRFVLKVRKTYMDQKIPDYMYKTILLSMANFVMGNGIERALLSTKL